MLKSDVMANFLLVTITYKAIFQVILLVIVFLNSAQSRDIRADLGNIVEYAAALNEDSFCTGDIQEFLEYIQVGMRDFPKPDGSDVIIVVGLSGVGKSTLVQFIGNTSNELFAICNRVGICSINDEAGSIGDYLISKTFLPNLVVDDDTNTPYFDMPGFNDNRNASIEVANSFFMHHVMRVSKRIKILLVATHWSFEVSQKETFINLMNNFANLFKNPSKFVGSIGLIATIADPNKSQDQLKYTYINFLNIHLKPALEDYFLGDKIRRVNETIDAILYSETGNVDDTKYLGNFMSPNRNGSLHELNEYVENHQRLWTLVHEDMKFTETDLDDFGIPLSDSAVLLLQRSQNCINEAFVASIGKISLEIYSTVLENLELIYAGNLTTLEYTTNLLLNISSQDYSFADVEDESVTFYAESLLGVLTAFDVRKIEPEIEAIKVLGAVVDFISQTAARLAVKPKDWVAPLIRLNSTFITNIGLDWILGPRV